MILAAGLSPAWQQIVALDRLAPGEVNRARDVQWCASGKVLNVGLALHKLSALPPIKKGGPGAVARSDTKLEPRGARTLTLVGGPTGAAIREELASAGVAARLIEARSSTRVCTTILDRHTGTTTELVENAGPIDAEELNEFEAAYRAELHEAEMVVLTGSFPAGIAASLYRELVAETPCPVVLDAQGEPLLEALAAHPFVVKPNREELGRALGKSLESDDDLHAAMREICRRGASWIVVTQGKGRVWVGSERELFSIEPLQVDVVNPIGSGDCLAAGLAIALARGESLPQAAAFGVAAAAENCRDLLPARLDAERISQLRKSVTHTASR